ncbi:unnamed protein product [Callosobruchus maculatus]|uniref:Endonuclease/exonuclease/phosphatase domain-containing protein n=1 Tax=Callosobruchus maculatus TaxID=64391 RepID=A0A653C967_CALMS|nr:unnamed protein product [Callosobruchus maculatus]
MHVLRTLPEDISHAVLDEAVDIYMVSCEGASSYIDAMSFRASQDGISLLIHVAKQPDCWCLLVTPLERANPSIPYIPLHKENKATKKTIDMTRHVKREGDFNLNFLSDNFYTIKLKNLLTMYGINQLISESTRITADSESLIDYVLANKSNVKAHVHHTPKITDHAVIAVNLLPNT